ncbi:polysaccharide deacetylase family protein [Streptomyces sp. NPDC087917]|uniref:polysaccharide deacetylase family protein n=1 Tax=Streptomyces sp. NPDC087917 TaxID=3155060 RepID=UPI003418108D
MSTTTSRQFRRRTTRAALTAAALGLASVLGATTASAATPPASPGAGPAAPAASTVPFGIARTASGGAHDVAITIDDGPDPVWTPKVLDVLKTYGVKATFCMIGANAQRYPGLVRDVVAGGHRLCDHSVDHDMTMDKKPVAYQAQQILDAQTMIERAAPGADVDYYRAPGGAFTPASRQIAGEHGMRPLGWSVDPKDWSRPGTQSIVSAVEGALPSEPTVLFHDGGGNRDETVEALRTLLPWFAQHGYAFTFPVRTTG